jgi:hypothetical protein
MSLVCFVDVFQDFIKDVRTLLFYCVYYLFIYLFKKEQFAVLSCLKKTQKYY